MRTVLLYHHNAPGGMEWVKVGGGYRRPYDDSVVVPAWALFGAGWRTEP